MAVYAESEDLINVGAYHQGSSPEIDEAIEKHGAIMQFLTQGMDERSNLEETLSAMGEIAGVGIPEEEKTAVLRKMAFAGLMPGRGDNDEPAFPPAAFPAASSPAAFPPAAFPTPLRESEADN
jgi:flagellum-specific ATP synthase